LPEPAEYLRGSWDLRNWRNVPGPFFGADTDTCWTGRTAAARHVLYDDEYGQEFIYRQPVTPAEVHDVLVAACSDPFGGYLADGDQHWTVETVRWWWRDRQRVIEWIYRARDRWHGSPYPQEQELVSGLAEFRRYINTGLETYLRGYAFWLAQHRAPSTAKLSQISDSPRRPGQNPLRRQVEPT
jgi:hypothetical protein